jgi:hypothetical protein
MIPTWPTTLPQCLEVAGYSSAEPDLLLRTPMEAGPAKQRRRSTWDARPVSGRITVTKAQLAAFQAFFKSSTFSGGIRFTWVDPETGDPAEMRFVSSPTWTAHGADKFLVALDLEILP